MGEDIKNELLCQELLKGSAEEEATNETYITQLEHNDTKQYYFINLINTVFKSNINNLNDYHLTIVLYKKSDLIDESVKELYKSYFPPSIQKCVIDLHIRDEIIHKCNYNNEKSNLLIDNICELLKEEKFIYKKNNYKNNINGHGDNTLYSFKLIEVDNTYIIDSITLYNNYTYEKRKEISKYIIHHNNNIKEYKEKIAQENKLLAYLTPWQRFCGNDNSRISEIESKYNEYEKILKSQNTKEMTDNDVNPTPMQAGKKSKKQPKKEILGKMICIYNIPGDRKDYVKHKGKLITLKDYKELMKSKKDKKPVKPKKSSIPKKK